MFGHPEVSLSFEGSPAEAELMVHTLEHGRIQVKTCRTSNLHLDHASMVPLYFLNKYWKLKQPRLILANPIGLTLEDSLETGKILAGVDSATRIALVASGDLSHRLTTEAPAGFHPDGQIFDNALVSSLKNADPGIIMDMDKKILSNAGECGLRSALVFHGISENDKVEVLSYEGPFGVGYCVARAFSDEDSMKADHDPVVLLARKAINNYLSGLPSPVPPLSPKIFSRPAACFVSLRSGDGRLRGCIGTIYPRSKSLGIEIIENAISAATQDPRFAPVRMGEMDRIRISVDILSNPEKTTREQLDTKIYGVIVEKDLRHGVLLPDLEGIDSIDQQVEIAAQKAGIFDPQGATLYRFTVERHFEGDR
jgi:AmmeMemoRadiSam system protein A